MGSVSTIVALGRNETSRPTDHHRPNRPQPQRKPRDEPLLPPRNGIQRRRPRRSGDPPVHARRQSCAATGADGVGVVRRCVRRAFVGEFCADCEGSAVDGE